MYLLYLDASGTPERQDPNSKHYVLVGLFMHEGSWFALDKRLQALKRKYCVSGTDPDHLEIHVKQFAVSIKEQDEIPDFERLSPFDRRTQVLELRRRKLAGEPSGTKKKERQAGYKQTEPYVHLTRSERSQLLDDAIGVIAGYDTIRLFGEAIDKAHPASVAGEINLREQAFTQVVARFDKFLQKQGHLEAAEQPAGRD